MIFTVAFWQGAGERLLKTFVQTFLATLTAMIPVGATSAFGLDWKTLLIGALGVALLAAFYSLATSIGNAKFTAGDSSDSGSTTPGTEAPAPSDPAPEPTPDADDTDSLSEEVSDDSASAGEGDPS